MLTLYDDGCSESTHVISYILCGQCQRFIESYKSSLVPSGSEKSDEAQILIIVFPGHRNNLEISLINDLFESITELDLLDDTSSSVPEALGLPMEPMYPSEDKSPPIIELNVDKAQSILTSVA